MCKMGKCKNITWFRPRTNYKGRKPYIVIRYYEKISESQYVINNLILDHLFILLKTLNFQV